MKKKRKINKLRIIGILLILLILVVGGGIGVKSYKENTIKPEIVLENESTINLKIGEEYTEYGAKATLNGIDITEKIIKSGEVESSKVGTYEIIYSVTNNKGKCEQTVKRTVNIIDDINPEIKLEGKESITLAYGKEYKEPGYTAIDNYDGDITAKVEREGTVDTKTAGTYTITYKVKDTSNNETTVKRTVVVKEKETVKAAATSDVNKKGLPVLMYHFFYDKSKGETGPDNNHMEISDFEEQVKYLCDNDYYFPTWSEVEAFVEGKKTLPAKSVVLTADDGDDSFYRLAIPVINKYDAKMTAFLITSWGVEANVKTYKSDKINFQSHSHNMHRGGASTGHGGIFQVIGHDKAYEDLTTSIKILGSNDAFCYPFGDVNDFEKSMLKETGFKLAFTTKAGKVKPGMDKLELPRVRMSKGISLKSFANML